MIRSKTIIWIIIIINVALLAWPMATKAKPAKRHQQGKQATLGSGARTTQATPISNLSQRSNRGWQRAAKGETQRQSWQSLTKLSSGGRRGEAGDEKPAK